MQRQRRSGQQSTATTKVHCRRQDGDARTGGEATDTALQNTLLKVEEIDGA